MLRETETSFIYRLYYEIPDIQQKRKPAQKINKPNHTVYINNVYYIT